MTTSDVFIKTYPADNFNIKEILRYAGCHGGEEEFIPVIKECISECEKLLTYKVCYAIFDIKSNESGADFGFSSVKSTLVSKKLCDCSHALVFGATTGIEIDRLIAKYSRITPSKALFFQAIGAERTESLCDIFCKDMQLQLNKDNLFLHSRFSPGYGDFDISFQQDIFRVLDPSRKIGLSLNESLLMSPSKSVTAIAGISPLPYADTTKKCGSCTKSDCPFRSNLL